MKTIKIKWMNAVVFLAITMALLPYVSFSAEKTWTGAIDNAWATSGNWSNGIPVAADTAVFDGSTMLNLSNTLHKTSQTNDVLSFTIDQTAAVTIFATNTGKLLLGKATASSATNLSVKAGNHKFVGANGGSNTTADFRFNGPVGGSHYLDVSGSASFELGGRINEAPSSPSDAYYKIGTGTLILSAHNGGTGGWSFSGGFRIQEGSLRFANGNAPGNSGNNYIVSSGAAIELTNNISSVVGAGTWTLNGTGVGGNGALRSTSTGTNTLSSSSTGTIVLNTSSRIGVDSGTLDIKRVITGNRSLTKVGAGTLVLATTNTYSGATIVQEGTLSLTTNQAIKALNPVTLSGGTLVMNTYSNALGSLTVLTDSVIDLGVGTGSLSFTNSSAISWLGMVTLTGTLGEKTLRFGQDKSGLSNEQKAMLKWSGGPLILDSNGYVIKRPGTLVMFF